MVQIEQGLRQMQYELVSFRIEIKNFMVTAKRDGEPPVNFNFHFYAVIKPFGSEKWIIRGCRDQIYELGEQANAVDAMEAAFREVQEQQENFRRSRKEKEPLKFNVYPPFVAVPRQTTGSYQPGG